MTRISDGVSVIVPSDWRALPAPGAIETSGSDPQLRAWLKGLAERAAEDGVVFCAFGLLEPLGQDPVVGAAVVLGVRSGDDLPKVDVVHSDLLRSDPAATLEMRTLPLVGPSTRLAWVTDAGGLPIRCVEYWVPFPGSDDRVAVLSASALPDDPDGARTAQLDVLAGTLAFVTSSQHTAAEALS